MRTRTCAYRTEYSTRYTLSPISLAPPSSSAPYHPRNGREMEAHLVQTRGRVPVGPFASPIASATSTSTLSAFCATSSTSAISPLPPPSRPLPSPPSLLPAHPHSQPQTHTQPRPSDETFTVTSTNVRSSVQTQTQRTSVSVPVSIPVSEIACTSEAEEGGGKKTKTKTKSKSKKEKAPKAPKVKKAKEVQEKVEVKQPRFVSVPCPAFRILYPSFRFISLHFMSGRSSPSLLCPFRPFLISVSSRSDSHSFLLFSFLSCLLAGFEFLRLKDSVSVSVDRRPHTVLSLTLTSPGSACIHLVYLPD